MSSIDKIYVSHCAKLADRGEYITKVCSNHPYFLKKHAEVITFTAEDDAAALAAHRYIPNLAVWRSLLKDREIFIAEQMYHIYDLIVRNGYDRTLILEDDFIIGETFATHHERLLNSIPDDGDCTFISSCCNLVVSPDYPGDFCPMPTSRCTSGYVVTRDFCKKVLATKYSSPIDWHLNFIQAPLNLKYYWSKELLVEQGSECQYKSNLR